MKFFATIFSIYILVLIAIPCADMPTEDTMQKIEIGATTSDHQHNDIDHCTPFCICDCCVSPFIQNASIQFTCSQILQSCVTEYYTLSVSNPFVSIWQPPKLS